MRNARTAFARTKEQHIGTSLMSRAVKGAEPSLAMRGWSSSRERRGTSREGGRVAHSANRFALRRVISGGRQADAHKLGRAAWSAEDRAGEQHFACGAAADVMPIRRGRLRMLVTASGTRWERSDAGGWDGVCVNVPQRAKSRRGENDNQPEKRGGPCPLAQDAPGGKYLRTNSHRPTVNQGCGLESSGIPAIGTARKKPASVSGRRR